MVKLGFDPSPLVWDRESAIGGTGRVSTPAAAFAGTLATRSHELDELDELADGAQPREAAGVRVTAVPEQFCTMTSRPRHLPMALR
jgi:hypothetical protein